MNATTNLATVSEARVLKSAFEFKENDLFIFDETGFDRVDRCQ